MSLQDFRAGYGLRTAHGIEEDQGRHDDHVRGEGALQDGLPEALPHAHPRPNPNNGADDQRREAGEPIETGRDVAGGAHDADEERDDQAGGDGGLGVQPEAEDQEGYRQRRPADAYKAGQSTRADPPEEREGGVGGALYALAVPLSRPRRGIGEREEKGGEHHLGQRLREVVAGRDPDQGRRRDRRGEERRRPPVDRSHAPHAPQRARESAEDDNDQARGDGLLDVPSRPVHEGRDEDRAPADAEQAGEDAAEQAGEAKD